MLKTPGAGPFVRWVNWKATSKEEDENDFEIPPPFGWEECCSSSRKMTKRAALRIVRAMIATRSNQVDFLLQSILLALISHAMFL